MLDPSTVIVFAAAALALLVVPGPAVIYIVTRSIHQGRTAGLISVLGIHVGTLVHVAAAALGVSAVLATSALAFGVVKYLGAAYLVFLGIRTLLARESGDVEEVPREGLRKVFGQGVVVNVLNPKTALFFLSFLPQFVDPANGPVVAQMLVLGLLFVGLGLVSDGTYALLGSALGDRLRRSPRFVRAKRYVTGGVYVSLGVGAALSGSRARAA